VIFILLYGVHTVISNHMSDIQKGASLLGSSMQFMSSLTWQMQEIDNTKVLSLVPRQTMCNL
jgi:hypothetical protein